MHSGAETEHAARGTKESRNTWHINAETKDTAGRPFKKGLKSVQQEGDREMKRILITAFEPFGGKTVNASAAVQKDLPERIGGFEVQKAVLPVVLGKAGKTALEIINGADFAMVFLLGEAGRDTVTPEIRARNLRSARIPDNEGNQPQEEKIRENGPGEYFTAVPAEKIVRRMQAEGYEISVSEDAGTFVCNDTFYLVGTGSAMPVEFIHVPVNLTERSAETVRQFMELAISEYASETAQPC